MTITALTIIHAFISFLLIVVVLLQFGKGAEMGATMGGSSQGVLSSSQTGNILTKATTILAILFLSNSVALSILSNKRAEASKMDKEAPIAAPLTRPKLDEKATGDKSPDAKKEQSSTPVTK